MCDVIQSCHLNCNIGGVCAISHNLPCQMIHPTIETLTVVFLQLPEPAEHSLDILGKLGSSSSDKLKVL